MLLFDISLIQNRDHSKKKPVMLFTETIHEGFVGISDRRPSNSFQADNALTPSTVKLTTSLSPSYGILF